MRNLIFFAVLPLAIIIQACGVNKEFQDINHPIMVGKMITPTKTIDDFNKITEMEIRDKHERQETTSTSNTLTHRITTTTINTTSEASVRPVMNYVDETNSIGVINWFKNKHSFAIKVYTYTEDAYLINILDN